MNIWCNIYQRQPQKNLPLQWATKGISAPVSPNIQLYKSKPRLKELPFCLGFLAFLVPCLYISLSCPARFSPACLWQFSFSIFPYIFSGSAAVATRRMCFAFCSNLLSMFLGKSGDQGSYGNKSLASTTVYRSLFVCRLFGAFVACLFPVFRLRQSK